MTTLKVLVKAPEQGWLTVQVAYLVPTPWNGSRRTGLKTVLTGAASRLELMADWPEFAAAAVAVPARSLLEVDARTVAAVEGLASSSVAVAA